MYKQIRTILFIITLSLQAQAGLTQADLTSLNLDIVKILQEYQIPGLAIAVTSDDHTIFKKTYGVISADHPIPIDTHTIFQIASLSKGFTGAAIAQLVDQNKIHYYDRISSILPEFTLKNRQYGWQLTLHHLLAMQSGLPRASGREILAKSVGNQELIRGFSDVESTYPPGTDFFSYQYAAFALLEEIIQRKSGLSYQQYLKEQLFIPLKMKNTDIGLPALTPQIARPHDLNNHPIERESFKINSAAGIHSSLDDMIIWLKFNINDSYVSINKTRNSFTNIDKKDLYNSDKIHQLSYGYLWRNFWYGDGENGIKVVEHAGGCSGTTSIISYLPKHKIGIVIMSNKFTQGPEIIRAKFLDYLIQTK